MNNPLISVLLAALAFLLSPCAGAASFAAKSFDDLVFQAQQILIADSTGSDAHYSERGLIVTDYHFVVLDTIKGGAASGPLTITMLGGKVGEVELTIPGAPKFAPGMRYFLFVSGNGTTMFPLVGGHQGMYQVRTDPETGQENLHDEHGRVLNQLPRTAKPANPVPLSKSQQANSARGTDLQSLQSDMQGPPTTDGANVAAKPLSLSTMKAEVRSRLKVLP